MALKVRQSAVGVTWHGRVGAWLGLKWGSEERSASPVTRKVADVVAHNRQLVGTCRERRTRNRGRRGSLRAASEDVRGAGPALRRVRIRPRFDLARLRLARGWRPGAL